jgi:hypothetical protein
VYRSSIEKKDSTIINAASLKRISDPCPWTQSYKRLPAHLCRVIGTCPSPPDILSITPSGIDLRTASDGSVENEKGYPGWIIVRMDNTTLIKGYGSTYGRIEDTTSYRTEVCSTIAILAVYGMVQSVYNWNAATIEHVFDSESALNHIWNKEKDVVFDQYRPDADAITAARVLLSSTKHTHISPKWVRGHADKMGPPYTLQEEINMQTDRLTGKAHANQPPEYKALHDCLQFPEPNVSIVLDGKKFTSRITINVAHSSQHPSLEQ